MKKIICSHKITREIERSLAGLGLEAVKLRGIAKFGEFHPLAYHPDMFCFKLRAGAWVFYEGAYENNRAVLDGLGLELIIERDPASGEYPHYIGLNCARVGGRLICAKKYANAKILSLADDIIDVKQGYARCSVCIAGEAVITADRNIYGNYPGSKLLIEPGHIDLTGYDYGFIGGCSGFFDGALLFAGDISAHPDYLRIRDFCEHQAVGLVSLSRERLRDYGGLFVI